MDVTGCPDGYARDNFISILTDRPCNVPVIGYWVLVAFTMSIRLLFTYINIKIALKVRERRINRARNRNGNGKVADSNAKDISNGSMLLQPTVIVELCFTINYFIMLLLFGLNKINATNGTGPTLYGFAGLFFGIVAILNYIKTVKLAMKIIPNVTHSNDLMRDYYLGKKWHELSPISADGISKMLFTLIVLCYFISVIFVLILPALKSVVHEPSDNVFTRIGFFFRWLFYNITGVLLVYHTFKITECISQVTARSRKSTPEIQKTLAITKALRGKSLILLFLIFSSNLIYFISAIGSPLYQWYFLFFQLMFATLVSFSSLTVYMGKSKKNKSSNETTKESALNAGAHLNHNIIVINHENNVSELKSPGEGSVNP